MLGVTMKIELRKIKTMQGLDCEVINAELWFDGKKVADVFNDGNGGSHNYYKEADITWEEIHEALKSFAIDNAYGFMAQQIGNEYAEYDDWAIYILLENNDNNKRSKKAVVFRRGDEDGFYTVSFGNEVTRSYAIKHIASKYPDAKVWEVETQKWVAVNA